MKKMVFHIRCEFPKKYDTNVHVLDLDNKTSDFKPVYFYEGFDKGRIWIDGIELKAKRAVQLRRGFSAGRNFTWGNNGYPARITALAICLHIFDTEQTAINMYLPFLRQIMSNWKKESFQTTVDLTPFISEYAERMQPNFYTKFFQLSYPALDHEINFITNKDTGLVTAYVAHLVCETLVYWERRGYEWRLPSDIFGAEPPKKASFDWQGAYDWKWTQIKSVWPGEDNFVIEAKNLRSAIIKVRQSLQSFAVAYNASKLYLETYG